MTKRNIIGSKDQPTLIELLTSQEAKPYTDGQQLFLDRNGKREGSWRMGYKSPVTGLRRKYTLGNCWLGSEGKKVVVMGMGLAEARLARHKATEQVAAGQDPNELEDAALVAAKAAVVAEKAAKLAQAEQERDARMRKKLGLPPKDSFADCCLRWAERSKTRLDPQTIKNALCNLAKHVYPHFGLVHIAAVTKKDVANALEAMAEAGIHGALTSVRGHLNEVFAWAMHPAQDGLLAVSPMYEDKALFDNKKKKKSHAALILAEDIRELMLAINSARPLPGSLGRHPRPTQARALRFAALCGQRSHNIAAARKEHFNLDAGMWIIPAILTKGRLVVKRQEDAEDHVVYLSRQSVTLLREQFAAYPASPWVFPGQGKSGHMARGALVYCLRDMGFAGLHTAHGFRAMMRTAGKHHAGLDVLALETMLAHKDAKESVEVAGAAKAILAKFMRAQDGGMPGVYDRTEELEAQEWERRCRETVQGWADWLEQLVRPQLKLAA